MTAPGEQLDVPSWQAGIDPRLVARLARVQRPGLIGLGLARRILGAVDALAGRLPLLARFPRAAASDRDSSAVPIVHVVPAGRGDPTPAPAATVAPPGRAAGTAPPVAPGRIVERRTERTIVERVTGDDRRAPGGGTHGGSEIAAVPRAREPRTPPMGSQRAAVDHGPVGAVLDVSGAVSAAPLVHVRDSTGAARSDGAPAAAASPAVLPRAVEQPRAALVTTAVADLAAQQSPPIVHALHASGGASASRAGAAPRDALGPIVPERVDEPRPAPAMIERVVGPAAGGGDGRGDARAAAGHSGASAAPTAPDDSLPAQRPVVGTTPIPPDARGRRSRMGAPLVERQASQVAPRTAPVEATLADVPGAERPELGRSRSAPRSVIVRARDAAPVAPSPSLTELAPALPRVAPRGARSLDAPRTATVMPRHIAAPAAGVVAPVVVSPQAAPATRGTAGPSLAHLAPATAPAADRGGAAAPVAPRMEATALPPHRPITARGPAAPAAPPLDLRQIAAGVQQIFARQAEHERARRGIRR